MKNLIKILIATALAASPAEAIASIEQKSPTTTFLQGYVHTLKSKVLVYNWFHANSSHLQGLLSSTDPEGFQYFTSGTQLYWKSFNKTNSGNFGTGLYLAVDPVYTESYGTGSGDGQWGLLQVELQPGFRFFNLARDGATVLSDEVQQSLREVGCDFKTIKDIFRAANNYAGSLPDSCINSIKHTVNDILQIDGFFYSYSSSYFKICMDPINQSLPLPAARANASKDRETALVITSSNSFKANNIKVFNAKSTDDRSSRKMIEAVFYKSLADNPPFFLPIKDGQVNAQIDFLRAEFHKSHPDLDPQNLVGAPEDSPENKDHLRQIVAGYKLLGVVLPVTIMTPTPVKESITPQEPQMYITHWNDLVGEPLNNDEVERFLRSNYFGCEKTAPY